MTHLYKTPDETDLVEEYLRQPKGPHSPELEAFVKTLLADPAAQGIVAVTLVPFKVWALATLPDDRNLRIVIERDRLFNDESEVERALFLRRLALRRAKTA